MWVAWNSSQYKSTGNEKPSTFPEKYRMCGGSTPTNPTKHQPIVASEQDQDIICRFGKVEYGEGLYNDAACAEQFND
jgi:hypothetical protein